MSNVTHPQAMAMILASLMFVTEHWDDFDKESHDLFSAKFPGIQDENLKTSEELKGDFEWLTAKLTKAAMPDILLEMAMSGHLTVNPEGGKL